MTYTRFTYTIMGRPKVKKLDTFMDLLNKNMKDFGLNETMHYQAEIGTFSFNIKDDEKQEEAKKKVLEKAKEVMEEKYLSDITFKFSKKEAYEPANEED